MTQVSAEPNLKLACEVDDHLWPWTKATPVLMLHGYARNASFWNRWIPALSEKHRVYRPELRGCGRTAAPPRGYRFEPATIARDILEVMDANDLERVHWVGESSGGILGLFFAYTYPDRIASVVACNSPIRVNDEIKRIYALDKESSAEAMLAHGVGEWCRQTLKYRLDLERASPELQEWYIEQLGKTPDYVATALIECFDAVDLMPILSGIKQPVLLMTGDKSKLSSEQAETMKRELQRGELTTFAGYGHGINLLAPERCTREALAFWERVDATS